MTVLHGHDSSVQDKRMKLFHEYSINKRASNRKKRMTVVNPDKVAGKCRKRKYTKNQRQYSTVNTEHAVVV